MIAPSNCYERKCAWYLGISQPDGTEMTERHYCAAFPDGIPEDITDGDNKHTEVQPNQQNTIVYERETQ